MLPLLSLMAAVVASPATAAECASSVPVAALGQTLDRAEAAWRAADEDGFLTSMEDAHLQLPCLDAVVPADFAARYHRDAGLWLFVSGSKDGARAAFASARRVQPDHQLPVDMLPARHPIRALFEGSAPSGETLPTPTPLEGSLLFDGVVAERPADGPAVAQLQGEAGTLSFTRYLRPGDALPDFPAKAPRAPGLLAQHPAGLALAAGSGALLLTGGVFALVARNTQQSFDSSPPSSRSELDALVDRNNAASTTSAVLLGVGGAVGVGAVFAW